MTVTTTANSITYAANGVTTGFAFPFIFFEPSDLAVTLINDATGSPTTNPPVLNGGSAYDYTVSGTFSDGAYASGGTVTFNTAPPAGYTVSLVRAVPATQDVTLIDNTKFPAQTVNREFDKLTVLVQQALAIAGGGGGGGGGGGAPVAGGPLPPEAPVSNSLWWNSEAGRGGGQLYFYYDDGFGSPQWVPASPASTIVGGPVATVASLGPASTIGERGFVTDASATTFNSVVAGGGANTVPVFSDGTSWRIG